MKDPIKYLADQYVIHDRNRAKRIDDLYQSMKISVTKPGSKQALTCDQLANMIFETRDNIMSHEAQMSCLKHSLGVLLENSMEDVSAEILHARRRNV